MANENKNFNVSFQEYRKGQNNRGERKSVENFLKQSVNRKKYKKKNKNVNFIDQLDKNKNIAEIINIQSYKEFNIKDDDKEQEKFDEKILSIQKTDEVVIEKTNEVVKKNCTCSIY